MSATSYPFQRRHICWLVLLACLAACGVRAQEALRNSLKAEVAAATRAEQMRDANYTIKSGDFRALISASAGFEWNDNINLSKDDPLDDYILTPSTRITSSYQLTQRNTLFLDVSLGYDFYMNHSDYNTFDMNSSSGTGLSFEVGIRDVTLNFHDWVSYVQDAAQSGQVSGTGNYGTFENTAGVGAVWELNKVTLSGGYDHQTIKSTSGEFDQTSRQAEMFYLRAGFLIHPKVTTGTEFTAAYTTYDENTHNDNDAYTAGLYSEFRPSEFLKVTLRGGFSTYQFQQTSSTVETDSQDSWYANININHRMMDALSYTLDAGREVVLGVESDLTETWYVRPGLQWDIIKDWPISTAFFYEHGDQGYGNVSGNLKETYDWYGTDINLRHNLTRNLSIGFNYRLTFRSSDQPDDEYTQNLLGAHLTYQFK